MKKMLWKGFLILATISQVGYAASALAVDGPGAPPQRFNGTVDRIGDHSIYIRTDEGPIQSYAIDKRERDYLRSFQEGERVVVETDWMHHLVDIYPATVLSSHASAYRVIHGKVQSFSPSDEQLTLRKSNGDTETYTVKDPAIRKLNSIKEGSRVTVQVDDEDRVVDVHRG